MTKFVFKRSRPRIFSAAFLALLATQSAWAVQLTHIDFENFQNSNCFARIHLRYENSTHEEIAKNKGNLSSDAEVFGGIKGEQWLCDDDGGVVFLLGMRALQSYSSRFDFETAGNAQFKEWPKFRDAILLSMKTFSQKIQTYNRGFQDYGQLSQALDAERRILKNLSDAPKFEEFVPLLNMTRAFMTERVGKAKTSYTSSAYSQSRAMEYFGLTQKSFSLSPIPEPTLPKIEGDFEALFETLNKKAAVILAERKIHGELPSDVVLSISHSARDTSENTVTQIRIPVVASADGNLTASHPVMRKTYLVLNAIQKMRYAIQRNPNSSKAAANMLRMEAQELDSLVRNNPEFKLDWKDGKSWENLNDLMEQLADNIDQNSGHKDRNTGKSEKNGEQWRLIEGGRIPDLGSFYFGPLLSEFDLFLPMANSQEGRLQWSAGMIASPKENRIIVQVNLSHSPGEKLRISAPELPGAKLVGVYGPNLDEREFNKAAHREANMDLIPSASGNSAVYLEYKTAKEKTAPASSELQCNTEACLVVLKVKGSDNRHREFKVGDRVIDSETQQEYRIDSVSQKWVNLSSVKPDLANSETSDPSPHDLTDPILIRLRRK